ncbi:MAG: hypothetical protein IJQ11_00325 [Bacteroidales bacterium]|nr:hypothetical protein [Bacteroidales bacterium]
MKKTILCAIMTLCLMSSSCDAQTRRRGTPKGNDEPPQLAEPVNSIVVKPTVNVYIENSGSMDGYVKGVTEFESAVYNYLSDIKISEITDTLNLYYINSQIISYAQGADADVIEDFINKLEPNEFKRRGGNRGTSDIADVIKSILRETKENNISILVTDGIFSPGRGKDAESYLVNQQIGIKNAVAEHLKMQPNTGVILYQLLSKFDGTYYNKVDDRIPWKGLRPYYIWVFGQANNLAKLREEVPEEKFNGSGVQRMLTFVPGDQRVNYGVVKSGMMSKKSTKTDIIGLEPNRKGDVSFSVNVDFRNLLLDADYLLDSDNYEVPNYSLQVKPNVNNENYTHVLTFKTDKMSRKNGELLIRLKMQKPNWEDVNDNEGSRCVEGKTYGVKYQVDGVYQAFANTTKTNCYTDIKINVKFK